MLVVAGRVNESIIIDKQVKVTVVKISARRILLVDAESHISVERGEIHLRKRAVVRNGAVADATRRKRVLRLKDPRTAAQLETPNPIVAGVRLQRGALLLARDPEREWPAAVSRTACSQSRCHS